MSISPLFWSERAQALYARDDLRFDPWSRQWDRAPQAAPDDLRPVDACSALLKLAGRLRQVPVGVIGPREASAAEYRTAEALGAALARHGLQLVCGGRQGVMEAGAKGHAGEGGAPIGLLPDGDWRTANPYIRIPIATGIGEARNAIIAQSCTVLIAVGGGQEAEPGISYGTVSEIALGLRLGHLVLGLEGAPSVSGMILCGSVEEAIQRTARHLLRAGG